MLKLYMDACILPESRSSLLACRIANFICGAHKYPIRPCIHELQACLLGESKLGKVFGHVDLNAKEPVRAPGHCTDLQNK